MCLDFERPPTVYEKECITEGWKVFTRGLFGYRAPIMHTTYNYLKVLFKRWFKAKVINNSQGFYVFLGHLEALEYADAHSIINNKCVVKKVEVKGILGVGVTGWTRRDAIRCEKIKIVGKSEFISHV